MSSQVLGLKAALAIEGIMDDQGLEISGSFGRDGEHCQSYRMLLLKRALGILYFVQVFSDFFSSRRILSSNQTYTKSQFIK